jgi:hypothetical protein
VLIELEVIAAAPSKAGIEGAFEREGHLRTEDHSHYEFVVRVVPILCFQWLNAVAAADAVDAVRRLRTPSTRRRATCGR